MVKLGAVILLAGVVLFAASCGGKKSATTGGSSATTTTTAGAAGTFTRPTAPAVTTPAKLEKLVGNPIAGKQVWIKSNCGSCHTLKAANSTGTIGMDFDYLKPTQEMVAETVPAGGDIMPAYPSMSAKQLNDLSAFVYKSTH